MLYLNGVEYDGLERRGGTRVVVVVSEMDWRGFGEVCDLGVRTLYTIAAKRKYII